MSESGNRRRTFLLYGCILIVAALLRFVDLDAKAFHHDESLYAYYSWIQMINGDYRYDPMMHGPFMYFLNVWTHRLLGVSGYAARTAPAVLGTLLCLLLTI